MQLPTRIVLYAIAVLNGLLFLNFPATVGGTGLDDSWRQSLAVLLKKHSQAGTEWIHSYGPLGHFGTFMYDADLFYIGFVWELLTKFILIICLWKLINSASTPPIKIALWFIVALFLPWVHPEAHTLILLTSLALLFVSRTDPRSKWFLLLVPFLFALFAHVKFVYFMFCSVGIVISEYQYRKRNLKDFLTPLPLYLFFFLLFWILTGQSISHLPAYINGSVQTANGYVEAMAYPGERAELLVAILIFILLSVVTAIRFSGTEGFASLVICMAGLFLSWKHGFVRQLTHTILFFSFTFFLSLILLAGLQRKRGSFQSRAILLPIALAICLVLSVVGMVRSQWAQFLNHGQVPDVVALIKVSQERLKVNTVSLLGPRELKLWCELRKTELQHRWEIPFIKSEVGERSIDVFSYEQGILFLNEMNWRQRPVFQSFHTFTPYLAGVNASFLESQQAPDFILYKLQTTDDRFPTLDDNQAFFSLLKWYTPQTSEKSYLLLKRSSDPGVLLKSSSQRTMRQRKIRFGEEVRINDIRGRFQKLQLNIEDSIAGKIRRFLFRPPVLIVRVKTSDQSELLYRFIPSMGRQGILINPLMISTGDFVRLYGLRDRSRVVSFCLLKSNNFDLWFRDEINMVLHSIARPTSVLIRDDSKVEQVASTLDTR